MHFEEIERLRAMAKEVNALREPDPGLGTDLPDRAIALLELRDVLDGAIARDLFAVDRARLVPRPHRSVKAWVGAITGTTLAAAGSARWLGARLHSGDASQRPLSSTAQALADRAITTDQARAIAKATDRLPLQAVPAAEEALLQAAAAEEGAEGPVRGIAPEGLAVAGKALRAALMPEQEAERAVWAHGERYLTLTDGVAGLVNVSGALPPHAGKLLRELLAPLEQPLRDTLEEADDSDERHHDTRRADAFIELLERMARVSPGAGEGERPLLVIDIDYRDLLDQVGREPDRAAPTLIGTLPDGTVIDPATTGRLLCDSATQWLVTDRADPPDRPDPQMSRRERRRQERAAARDIARCQGSHRDIDPFDLLEMVRASIGPALGGTAVEALALGRSVRTVTAGQRRVLNRRDKGCVVRGCPCQTHRTQAHHRLWWGRDDGPTDVADMVLICLFHHQLVHAGWRLVRAADGAYDLVAPDS